MSPATGTINDGGSASQFLDRRAVWDNLRNSIRRPGCVRKSSRIKKLRTWYVLSSPGCKSSPSNDAVAVNHLHESDAALVLTLSVSGSIGNRGGTVFVVNGCEGTLAVHSKTIWTDCGTLTFDVCIMSR
jgi:hypothetical protein